MKERKKKPVPSTHLPSTVVGLPRQDLVYLLKGKPREMPFHHFTDENSEFEVTAMA